MSDRHTEITAPQGEIDDRLRRLTRRGFLIGGFAAGGAVGVYEWLTHAQDDDEAPWPQRRVLDWNGRLAHAYLRDSHLMPTYSLHEVTPLKPNGNIGMEDSIDAATWRFQFQPGDNMPAFPLSLSDIKSLPKLDLITRLCCIEGWSAIVHWSGARFSDFVQKYCPPGRDLPPYVYMATPDEDYYVGLDTKSAMHPQTLLAYERNGQPLEEQHGAPLRLVMPVKYGIKNIKRIGLIRFMNKRPGDYWAEEGYDWFAGL